MLLSMLEFFKYELKSTDNKVFQRKGVGMRLTCDFIDDNVNLATNRTKVPGDAVAVLNLHMTCFLPLSVQNVFNILTCFVMSCFICEQSFLSRRKSNKSNFLI